MSQIPITEVVTIQVAESPAGLAEYQVNNLAIFTDEAPDDVDFIYGVYSNPTDVGTEFGTSSEVYDMALKIFSQAPNILSGNGRLIVFYNNNVPVDTSDGDIMDTVSAAANLVFFGGFILAGTDLTGADAIAMADFSEANRKLWFYPKHLVAAMESGGDFYDMHAAGYEQTRKLLYTTSAAAARLYAAAYAGRAMSVNFDGSNTVQTMHMKDLDGILPDEVITTTSLTTAKAIGVDVYINIGGLSKVFSTSGAGVTKFFDQIYNLNWLVAGLQVAGFNAISTVSTKLPQTEAGVAVLRNAYIDVLQRGVTNGYLAPGAWNSPDRFGNTDDLLASVLQVGWYLYSQPVVDQSQTAREARQAPVIQIAAKESGAIHSSNVIVYVNA